jgi:hypothetical protein
MLCSRISLRSAHCLQAAALAENEEIFAWVSPVVAKEATPLGEWPCTPPVS